MRAVLRASLVGLCSAGMLTACGGGARIADNKEAAASAAFAASRGAGSAQSMTRTAVQQAVTTGTSVTVDCPNGGTVAVAVDLLSSGGEASVAYDLTYNNCNYDGANSLRGSVQIGMTVVGSTGSSISMALTLDGRVEFSGQVSDFVDMNLTQTVDIQQLTETSGTVGVVLDGTITTSSGTYTYDQETLVITADGIPTASEG